MDPGQQFCLRWNNYQSTLHHVFHKLWVSGTFVDVSLVVEGRLDCHRVVLSACSSYFEHIPQDHSSHPHPLILLHDLPYSAVEALVIFMYRGEVNVSHEQLAALLRVAETLQVKGLADSASINSFTKRQLLERCIPLLEHAPPTIPPLGSVPVITSHGAVTVPTTSINQPRMTTTRSSSTCMNLSRTAPGVMKNMSNGVVKKVEGQAAPSTPGPRRKRLRSEEPVASVPTYCSSSTSTSSSMPSTPPASLNDTPGPESSQPSPGCTTTFPEMLRQDPADETDGELQIDESADQSPVEPAENVTSPIDGEIKIESEKEDSSTQSPSLSEFPAMRLPDPNLSRPKQDCVDQSHQFPQLPQASHDGMPVKERPGNIGGKSCERTYTHLDLEEGIEAVLIGQLTPAKAIAQYKIPRRTFFRRLSAVRKSRGIPSAKENAADHFLTNTSPAVGETGSSILHPSPESDSYAASFKVKSERPVLIAPKEEKNKCKKGDEDESSNSYFSLLNLAASNKYDAYLNYLKLVARRGDSSSPEEVIEALRKGQALEGKPAVDDNRNVSEAALALVTNNVSAE